jgi:hypothetical protein
VLTDGVIVPYYIEATHRIVQGPCDVPRAYEEWSVLLHAPNQLVQVIEGYFGAENDELLGRDQGWLGVGAVLGPLEGGWVEIQLIQHD